MTDVNKAVHSRLSLLRTLANVPTLYFRHFLFFFCTGYLLLFLPVAIELHIADRLVPTMIGSFILLPWIEFLADVWILSVGSLVIVVILHRLAPPIDAGPGFLSKIGRVFKDWMKVQIPLLAVLAMEAFSVWLTTGSILALMISDLVESLKYGSTIWFMLVVLFFVMQVYLFSSLFLSAVIITREGLGPFRGIQKSWRLMRGNRIRLIPVLLIFYLISSGINWLFVNRYTVGEYDPIFIGPTLHCLLFGLVAVAMAESYRQLTGDPVSQQDIEAFD